MLYRLDKCYALNMYVKWLQSPPSLDVIVLAPYKWLSQNPCLQLAIYGLILFSRSFLKFLFYNFLYFLINFYILILRCKINAQNFFSTL